MTATSDRRRGPQAGIDVAEWGQRSVFGATRGWPWWAAVLVALVLSMAGAAIDMHFSGNLSKVFDGAYFVGCVLAVCFVRRRNVFGPMVQAPLILAVTVPVVVAVTKGLGSSPSLSTKLIALGVPLVTGFPTMAITTIATVLIGGIRFLVQRKPQGLDLDDDDRGRDDRRRPDRGDRDRAERDRDRADRFDRDADSGRGGRPGAERRQRPAGSGRPGQDRAARDDRGAPRDRTRMQPPSDRGDAADRGRGGSGRSGADRDRGQAARGGQSRDRGGQPQRGARPSRDDVRRQPPRRRDDEY